jgi:hypothetical protein
MLIKQPSVRIASKEITLATGELARAYFALVTIEGYTEVRFLGIQPVEASESVSKASEAPVALLEPCFTPSCEALEDKNVFESASPYFSLDLLINQLARAPSAL